MVGIKLQGGMANQLFQIAAAQALAWRNNDTAIFNFDECFTPLQGNPSNHYKDTILKNIKSSDFNNFKFLYREPKHSYIPIPYQKDIFLMGYFQSIKYWEDYENEIRDLFYLEYKNLNEIYEKEGIFTSVHVRRGDYLKNPHIHPTLPIEYYNKAMGIIGISNFIFFSDDMAWVKENFKGDNIIYSENNNEIEEMELQAYCTNNIIANSTYSWFAAFFNKNKNKKVVSPGNKYRWFGPSGPQDQQDIVPDNWIKI